MPAWLWLDRDSRMLPKGIEIYIAAVREMADKITQQLKSK